jgi:hypothetical protein
MIRTIAITTAALRDCPVDIPERPALAANLDDIKLRRSERYFQIAAFYDKSSYTPETRIAAYRDYLRRFPKGPHADQARARLAELEQTIPSSSTTP